MMRGKAERMTMHRRGRQISSGRTAIETHHPHLVDAQHLLHLAANTRTIHSISMS